MGHHKPLHVCQTMDDLQKWVNRPHDQDSDQETPETVAGGSLVVASDWITGGTTIPISDRDSPATVATLLSQSELLSVAGPSSAEQVTSRHPRQIHRFISNSGSNSSRGATAASSSSSTSFAHARTGDAGSGESLGAVPYPSTSSGGSSGRGSRSAAADSREARDTGTQHDARSYQQQQQVILEMLDREIGACSKSCLCACYASSTLQELKSLHSKMQGIFFASLSTTSQQALHARLASVLLPTLAAKLFDPAGRHKLAAVQDALGELQQLIVLPVTRLSAAHGITSTATQEEAALLAASKESALGAALAAGKSGLCGHLCWHLDSLSRQVAELQIKGDRKSHTEGFEAAAAPRQAGHDASPDDVSQHAHHIACDSLLAQPAATQHLLAQLLLVYQSTAALCRIWPSSIPDAKSLSNLLSSSMVVAGQLMTQPELMQDTRLPRTPTGVSGPAREADGSSAAVPSTQPLLRLAGPVTAAVLEVAALVLEPLGMLLHPRQLADLQGTQPPSLSASAEALADVLQCSAQCVLTVHVMLTVCLHQLVLHAGLKHDSLTQEGGSCVKQGAECGTASQATASGSSDGRTIAELAEGYLLQHADTLQAKQPAGPSRAAVMAWRAVCERQWADMHLPLTLQEAAGVLASIHPSVAAASSSGCVGDPGAAAALQLEAVWAMQGCGPLDGSLGEAATSSASTINSTSTASWSTSTGSCDSSGSARGLSAVSSEPILSISSCTQTATALSAICSQLAQAVPAGRCSCTLACSLLATAAAAVGLQGPAALQLVSAAVAAATILVKRKPPARESDEFATAEQHAEGSDTVQSRSHESGSAVASSAHAAAAPAAGTAAQAAMESSEAVAAGLAAAAPAAVSAAVTPVVDGWQLCLSLAADLTTAVLQLAGDPALEPYHATGIDFDWQCGKLLQFLLHCQNGQVAAGTDTDTAVQLRQFQSFAYTIQLLEAVIRRNGVSAAVAGEYLAVDTHGLQLNARAVNLDCFWVGYGAVQTALGLACRVDQSVLGSLQGQQLLQSCTSTLLTCSSLLHSISEGFTPRSLYICVQLLQLLELTEALAAGDSSCGMSQPLAAGMLLVGRCLLSIVSQVSPPCTGDSSSSSVPSLLQQGMDFSVHLHDWLSGVASQHIIHDGDDAKAQLQQIITLDATSLQQAMDALLRCMSFISQGLQQRAAVVIAAPVTAADAVPGSCGVQIKGSSSIDSSPAGSTSTSGGSSRPEARLSTEVATGSAACSSDAVTAGVQHNYKQQQQPPADGLLNGVHTAHTALQKVLLPLTLALTPHLEQEGVTDAQLSAADPAWLLSDRCSLPASLAAAGEALCAAVPSSACCSNPRCTNLAGVSAGFALVRGKGCVCGGCLGVQAGGAAPAAAQGALVAARYCSRECQVAHRQQHKDLCGRLANRQQCNLLIEQ